MINLFSQECHIKAIVQCVTFRDSSECPWDSLELLQVSLVLTFVLLIPLNGCTTVYLPIHLLTGIWVVCSF